MRYQSVKPISWLCVLLVACALILSGGISLEAAEIECGQTLENGSFYLRDDLDCTGYDVGLTLVNASLYMNRHTLSGASDTGIEVLAEGSKILYGKVTECGVGVVVNGDNNAIIGVSVTGNDEEGMIVNGDNNRLLANKVADNGGDGIEVNGSGNNIFNNKASGNESEGIGVAGGSNRIVRNTVIRNEEGIEIEGTGACDNDVRGNMARENTGAGIIIEEGATNNKIISNVSLRNGTYDLSDDQPDCDENTWRVNISRTRNQNCIR